MMDTRILDLDFVIITVIMIIERKSITEAVNYLMSDGMTYDEAIAYLENEGGAF